MKVAFQGVKGAYSEMASIQYFKGKDLKFYPKDSFGEVFKAVCSGKVNYGVIPVENSWAGSIVENSDLLAEQNVWVEGETKVAINHCLMVNKKLKSSEIKEVISHPQALSQCANYLKSNKYQASSFYDTAGAAKFISENPSSKLAAIASERAAKDFNLKIIEKKIQDSKDNFTRFFIIRKPKKTDKNLTGRNKTSISFSFKNEPGALYKALSIFAIRDIDLSKIESRPVKGTKWNYRFYVDVLCGFEDEKLKFAIGHLEEIASEVKVLGSYKMKK